MGSLGRYTLTERLGRGGMAEVWKARIDGPSGFEKFFAVKCLLPGLPLERGIVDMFIAEAKLVARLSHPNIVQVVDFGTLDGRHYIALEYVDGFNLVEMKRRLAAFGARLPLEVTLFLLAECCKGLAHAHGARDDAGRPLAIVHRDVSPQNILISRNGDVKIADFGIAKVAGAISHTAPGVLRAKLQYMSPEQARLEVLDPRTDLFSLAVTFWQLLAGRPFYTKQTDLDLVHEAARYRFTEEVLAPIPSNLRPFFRVALQEGRENRFQDASRMEAAALEHLGVGGMLQSRNALASVMQRLLDEVDTQVSGEGAAAGGPGPAATTCESVTEAGKTAPTPTGVSATTLVTGAGAPSPPRGGWRSILARLFGRRPA